MRVGTDTNWFNVAVGANHIVAIRVDGSLWGWGDNQMGQFDVDGRAIGFVIAEPTQFAPFADWIHAAAGGNRTTAINADGGLRSWGS